MKIEIKNWTYHTFQRRNMSNLLCLFNTSVILLTMSAQYFSKTIFISTSHNSQLTTLYSYHAYHISQLTTLYSYHAYHISQFTTLYSYHASHISQFFTCITHLTTLYTHHVSESTDTRAPIIMAKSPILNTIFRKASHGTLKLT